MSKEKSRRLAALSRQLEKSWENITKLNERVEKLKKEIFESRQKKFSSLKLINELVLEHWEIPADDFQKILGETLESLVALIKNYHSGELSGELSKNVDNPVLSENI